MWFLGPENKWIDKLHNMRSVKSAYSPQKIRKMHIQHSPAPTLPRVTLNSQLRYFELGPQNPELS